MRNTVDRELSLWVARKIRARPKECFKNATKALLAELPELRGARYCEGVVLFRGAHMLPWEHAWLRMRDRRIVDPTLYKDRLNYQAAVTFGPRSLAGAIFKGGMYGVLEYAQMRAAKIALLRRLGHRDLVAGFAVAPVQ